MGASLKTHFISSRVTLVKPPAEILNCLGRSKDYYCDEMARRL